MEFRTSKTDLAAALVTTAAVASRKSTMPILATVLLTTGQGKLTAAATDLSLSAVGEVDAEIVEAGKVAVDARRLSAILKGLPPGRVCLKVKGEALEIVAGRDRFEVPTVDAKMFPAMPTTEGVTFVGAPATQFVNLLSRVLPSVCTDVGRYNINALLLICEAGKTRAVGTDGHRLVTTYAEDPQAWGLKAPKWTMSIPRAGAVEILRLLRGCRGGVELGASKGLIFVRHGGVVLSVNLSDGFPPWEKVVPADSLRSCTVERVALAAAVRRLLPVLDKPAYATTLRFAEGCLTLNAKSLENGSASVTIDADYSGAEFVIGINANYILGQLTAAGTDLIWIGTTVPLDPMVFKSCNGAGQPSEDYLGVVMPMRLEEVATKPAAKKKAA